MLRNTCKKKFTLRSIVRRVSPIFGCFPKYFSGHELFDHETSINLSMYTLSPSSTFPKLRERMRKSIFSLSDKWRRPLIQSSSVRFFKKANSKIFFSPLRTNDKCFRRATVFPSSFFANTCWNDSFHPFFTLFFGFSHCVLNIFLLLHNVSLFLRSIFFLFSSRIGIRCLLCILYYVWLIGIYAVEVVSPVCVLYTKFEKGKKLLRIEIINCSALSPVYGNFSSSIIFIVTPTSSAFSGVVAAVVPQQEHIVPHLGSLYSYFHLHFSSHFFPPLLCIPIILRVYSNENTISVLLSPTSLLSGMPYCRTYSILCSSVNVLFELWKKISKFTARLLIIE